MRSDFKKVLTERARDASARGYREVRAHEARHEVDDLPTIQGMRRPYISHYGADAKSGARSAAASIPGPILGTACATMRSGW
jgi:hypothetical protein